MKLQRVRIEVETMETRGCLFRLQSPTLNQAAQVEIESRYWFLKRLENTYQSALRALETADGGFLGLLQRMIRFLESKIDPDEFVMKQLRKADVVELFYPPSMPQRWVRRMFRRFIRRQVLYHTRWLLINLFLLPFTGAMMVIPGPNIFFGWNAFRVVSHYLAREGGHRVQRSLCELRFMPEGQQDMTTEGSEGVPALNEN